jgi:hypothetical protein
MASNLLGGQHFGGVNILWVSTFLGGQHFLGVNNFGGKRGRGFRVLACTDTGAKPPLGVRHY